MCWGHRISVKSGRACVDLVLIVIVLVIVISPGDYDYDYDYDLSSWHVCGCVGLKKMAELSLTAPHS
jgi:hypothetical protein